MNRLASPAQLRASLIRWTLFVLPAVLLLGLLSARLGGSGAENQWLAVLEKPALYPAGMGFTLFWGLLYVLMGVAFAGVCSAWGSHARGMAIAAFLVHFTFNLAWAPVFFALHRIDLALAIMLVMVLAAAVTTWLFFRVRRWSGWLMLACVGGLIFAGLLNWQFLTLNPDAASIDPLRPAHRIEL